MSWAVIRPQVKTLLQSISTIQEVSGTPLLNFSGYPAAIVVPSDNDGDYETTSENKRTYAFKVQLYYETKSTGIEGAMEALEGLVDTVLDTIDQEDQKGVTTRTVGIDLPARYTFLNIWASPGVWGRLDEENLLMTELLVKVRVSVDVT